MLIAAARPVAPHVAAAAAQPTPPPAGGPVVAQFSYVIRGPQGMPHLGVIDAQLVQEKSVAAAVGASFEDAVRLAHERARQMRYDGIHGLPINQCQAIMEARDGTYSIVPLEGFHRERTGPLFVDGLFFDKEALSLQLARRAAGLVAIVGTETVVDLRGAGGAVVLPKPRP